MIEERSDDMLLHPAATSITEEERERFFDELDEQIAPTQRDDPTGWAAELEERRIFEATLLDGLEDEAVMDER